MGLILPGDPEFEATLSCFPMGWQQVRNSSNGDFALVARSDTGLLEAVPWGEAVEYIEGGEWDERLTATGGDDELVSAGDSDTLVN